MKKVFEKLKLPKKKESKVLGANHYSSNQLCKDAVPEAPRDLKSDVPLKENLYKNFRIDNSSNCKSTKQCDQNYARSNIDSMTSVQENSLNYFHSSSLSSEAVPIDDINSRQRSVSAPQEIIPDVPLESHVITNGHDSGNRRSNLSENESGSGSESSESEIHAPSGNENENSLSVNNDNSILQKKPKQKKNKTYVININNSRNFQIGSQKNVYVNSPDKGSLQIKNLKSSPNEEQNLSLQNDMLNVTRAITTREIAKIAPFINNSWKEIGKQLNIPQSEIDEIVMVNDNNSNIIAFDMLKRFLEKNPETSVGFIANVLLRSNQHQAVKELIA